MITFHLRSVAPKPCFQIFILTLVTQTNSTAQQNQILMKTHEFSALKTIIRVWKHEHEHVECKKKLTLWCNNSSLGFPCFRSFLCNGVVRWHVSHNRSRSRGSFRLRLQLCHCRCLVGKLNWETENTEAEWEVEKQRKCYYLYYLHKFQETWWTLNKVMVSKVFNYIALRNVEAHPRFWTVDCGYIGYKLCYIGHYPAYSKP